MWGVCEGCGVCVRDMGCVCEGYGVCVRDVGCV